MNVTRGRCKSEGGKRDVIKKKYFSGFPSFEKMMKKNYYYYTLFILIKITKYINFNYLIILLVGFFFFFSSFIASLASACSTFY